MTKKISQTILSVGLAVVILSTALFCAALTGHFTERVFRELEAEAELAAQGVTAMELCAGFGNEGIARIQRAVGPGVAVGAVKFDFHPGLGFKSGDALFG